MADREDDEHEWFGDSSTHQQCYCGASRDRHTAAHRWSYTPGGFESTHGWYRLDGHVPVPVHNFRHGGMGSADSRRVARTQVTPGIEVSTVFLALDHRFKPTGLPLLFETMVFGGPMDQQAERYCTWEEAAEGHRRWVERVTGVAAAAFADVEETGRRR